MLLRGTADPVLIATSGSQAGAHPTGDRACPPRRGKKGLSAPASAGAAARCVHPAPRAFCLHRLRSSRRVWSRSVCFSPRASVGPSSAGPTCADVVVSVGCLGRGGGRVNVAVSLGGCRSQLAAPRRSRPEASMTPSLASSEQRAQARQMLTAARAAARGCRPMPLPCGGGRRRVRRCLRRLLVAAAAAGCSGLRSAAALDLRREDVPSLWRAGAGGLPVLPGVRSAGVDGAGR